MGPKQVIFLTLEHITLNKESFNPVQLFIDERCMYIIQKKKSLKIFLICFFSSIIHSLFFFRISYLKIPCFYDIFHQWKLSISKFEQGIISLSIGRITKLKCMFHNAFWYQYYIFVLSSDCHFTCYSLHIILYIILMPYKENKCIKCFTQSTVLWSV